MSGGGRSRPPKRLRWSSSVGKSEKSYTNAQADKSDTDRNTTQDAQSTLPKNAKAWHDLFRGLPEKAMLQNEQQRLIVAEDQQINYDHHTGLRHYPKRIILKSPSSTTEATLYPVPLLPNQYSEPERKCSAKAAALKYSYSLQSAPEEVHNDQSETEPAEEIEPPEPSPIPAEEPEEEDPDLGNVCNKCREPLDKRNPYQNDLSYVTCSSCKISIHPTCAELPESVVSVVKKYNWECTDCKTCRICSDMGNEGMFLFCDECDHGYHTYCVGLSAPPKGNRWVCDDCGVCASCGKTQPGEGASANMRWKHEYSKGTDTTDPVFLQTLCLACSKLFRSGNFCPICLKVYRNSENLTPMVCCDRCDQWIHIDCDNISEREYKLMSESERAYTCAVCRGDVPSRV